MYKDGKIKFYKVDVDKNIGATQAAGVSDIPAFMVSYSKILILSAESRTEAISHVFLSKRNQQVYKNGKKVGQAVGSVESKLKELIEKHA